ncbi:RICIN domain-containing protein [bacterium]|nr:RICIN domain-containing protein [bacterium]
MKTVRVLLAGVLCLLLILTSLSGCKAQEPDEYQLQTGRPLGMGGGISSSVLQVVLGDLASGALSWASGAGCEFIFGLITGSEDKVGDELKDIKDKLKEMDKKLDDIKRTVEEIRNKVNEIGERLKIMQWDAAISDIIDPMTKIQGAFTTLQDITEEAKVNPSGYLNDADFKNLTQNNCDTILSDRDGVKNALNKLNLYIIGVQGKTPLLNLMYTQVLEKLSSEGISYDDRIDCYNAFDLFFTGLVGLEIQGVQLIINAYAFLDDSTAATRYLRRFYEEKLVPQVELFSSIVEELVWNDKEMGLREVILDPEPYIFLSADSLTHGLLSTVYVEDGKLQVSEDKGAITVRIKYANDAPYLREGALDIITLNNESGDSIILESSEAKIYGPYTILKYTMDAPEVGVYSLDTKGYEDIFHDYGEKDIVITNENRYGYIGIYAWKPYEDRYYKIISKESGKCIETTGSMGDDNIQQWQFFGLYNQIWRFDHVGDGYYKIVSKYSGMVLDVRSLSKDDKANIIQWKWNNTDNQLWRLHLLDDGTIKIISKNSGKVIDVLGGTTGGSTKQGANIIQYHWRGEDNDNQRWHLEMIEKGKEGDIVISWFKIVPKHGGSNVLDVSGAGGQGANIQIWGSNNSNAQRWKLEHIKDNIYRLTPKHNTKLCADVAAPYGSNATVHAWTYSGLDNQRWKIQPIGDGYYRFKCVKTNKYMHIWSYYDSIGKADDVNQTGWRSADKKNDVYRWRLVVPTKNK